MLGKSRTVRSTVCDCLLGEAVSMLLAMHLADSHLNSIRAKETQSA